MELNKQPTSVLELSKYSQGVLLELPPFVEGQAFVARLKRPSLIRLVSKGNIPNALISVVNDMFNQNKNHNSKQKAEEKNSMEGMSDLLELICEASFVEPSYKELKDNNIELTDEQMLFVFEYAQSGVTDLVPFSEG